MKNIIKDESGLSYGLIIFFAAIIFFTLLMIFITPFLNTITTKFNEKIAAGFVSNQAASAFAFTFEMRSFYIIAFVIGCILWLYVRALEQKENPQ